MPYSKRWNLIHLLGGKCRDCNEENFGLLEIHHRFNDGDIDRKYYTQLNQKYLNQPQRAKERLEVLCKNCHEKSHHSSMYIPTQRDNKIEEFIQCLKSLEGDNKVPISEQFLIESLFKTGSFGSDTNFIENLPRTYIRKMLRDASIYESKPNHYNRV